jgi:MjaI restriction endonuclease
MVGTKLFRSEYGQLEKELGVKIEPAPDKWDRLYNVDFFIKVRDEHIGLQIKPASAVSHIPEIFKERNQQAETHKNFTKEYGGKVFYVISMKEGANKVIANKEVIDEIGAEIKRLSR